MRGGGGGVCDAPEANCQPGPQVGEDLEGGDLGFSPDSPSSSVPAYAYVFLLGLDVSPS